MRFDNIHSVYFLGIGGIGMSALAQWFKAAGKDVSGYDKTQSRITEKLISKGISIHFEEDIEAIPEVIKVDPENSLIIYTPAIPKEHKEKIWFEENEFSLHKRSEILGNISSAFPSIAIAGTHGKTSVTSMIAHILNQAGKNITAFVGGVMKNYESNVIIGDAVKPEHWVLAEADEFDRSFLRLRPDLAVITSAEADHLDIYGKEETLQSTFREFASQIRDGGKLFVQSKFYSGFDSRKNIEVKDYELDSGKIKAENITIVRDYFRFDYVEGDYRINDIELMIPGFHNVENALAAISVCRTFKLEKDRIKEAVKSYRGVSRRFDVILRKEEIIYIDDYAHHPTEISALLKSVKHIYPGKKITAIFQPHLFSRTRDFAEGFSKSLSAADRVILLPIYPAREKAIPGISSEILLRDIETDDKACLSKEDALSEVRNINEGVLLTIGAGDIDQLVPKIEKILNE